MQELLLATQIAAIVTFIGSAFFLYHLLVKVNEARIGGLNDEIDRLKARLESPSDLQAKLDIAETLNKKHIAQLESEKQAAIDQGNKALEKEKAESLESLRVYAVMYADADKKLQEYKKSAELADTNKKAITEALKGIRLTDYLETDPTYKGSLFAALGSFKGLTLSSCPSCAMSLSKCSKCKKPFCGLHAPPGRGGLGFMCTNCEGNTLRDALGA